MQKDRSDVRGQGSGSVCEAPCSFTRAATLQAPAKQIPWQMLSGASFTFETLNIHQMHSPKFQSELSETPSPVIRWPDRIWQEICLTGACCVTCSLHTAPLGNMVCFQVRLPPPGQRYWRFKLILKVEQQAEHGQCWRCLWFSTTEPWYLCISWS